MPTQYAFEPEQTPSVPRPPTAPASAAGPSSMAQVAAQERVSAKELASALAAIETRRTTSARYEAGTITVGEAVEQLNLDIAPSEVLTEILAQRQQALDETTLRRKTRQRRVAATVFPLTFLGLLLAFIGLFSVRQRAVSDAQTPSAPFMAVVSDARPAAAAFNPQTLRVRDTNPKTGEVVIRTLAEVENNRPVTVNSSDLLAQFPLTSKDDFVVNMQVASQAAQWTLIKHDGVPYLRGYIGAKMSPAALASGEVVVCNNPENPGGVSIGPSPRPITVRLDALGRGGTMDSVFDEGGAMVAAPTPDWQRIVLPKLTGDAHLWER